MVSNNYNDEEVVFDPEVPYIKEIDEFKDDPYIFE